MPFSGPNFSPYPFDRVRRLRRKDAALESMLARWISGRPLGARSAAIAGGPVSVRVLGVRSEAGAFDPHAARAEVRIGGLALELLAASRPIRALAQRLLGGPPELEAPRALTSVEHAIWALGIAAAIEDTGIAAEVWPCSDRAAQNGLSVELLVDVGGTPMTVVVRCPEDVLVRVAPVRRPPAWTFDFPVILGACVLPRETLNQLAPRDVVTIEPRLALVIGAGSIGLSASPNAVEARVMTGYVPREMPAAIADEAHLELTVQLGTTRLSLRQLAELAPGQVIALGRPLAGPFEIHAGGRLLGAGELVDVDGEVGVRIVSLQE